MRLSLYFYATCRLKRKNWNRIDFQSLKNTRFFFPKILIFPKWHFFFLKISSTKPLTHSHWFQTVRTSIESLCQTDLVFYSSVKLKYNDQYGNDLKFRKHSSSRAPHATINCVCWLMKGVDVVAIKDCECYASSTGRKLSSFTEIR